MTNQKINNAKVLIWQPKEYPTELILLMKNIFSLDKRIKNAYLAYMQYADPNASPNILIGLEVDENFEIVIANLKAQMQSYDYANLEFTDANNGPFKNYFSNLLPFYARDI